MGTYFFRVLIAFALLGLGSMVTPDEVFAGDEKSRTITMTGRASVGAAPDRVEINLGVMSKGATAREALSRNNENMSSILETLKENGVKKKYIQTSNFSIQPEYQRFKNGEPPKVRGYSVNNTVRIHLTDIEKLGGLLDQVVTSGSNQINGIRFYVSKEDKIKDGARKLAVKAAQRKAQLYGEAAGVELGDVLTISENAHGGPQPRTFARNIAAEAMSVPIEGGEQQLSVTVTITWQLK